MKESFYKKLQDDLTALRFLYDEDSLDQYKCDAIILSIKEARKKISMHSPLSEKEVLLNCIDTLFEVLEEGYTQKILDFLDAIHSVPEIYMLNRNLFSLRNELKAFQKKYGKHYFNFIDEIKPHFSKRAPKNKWEFFSAASDEDFKKLHPVGYNWLCFAGITALMLPSIIYIAYCLFINPAPDEWWLILGGVGTFIIGVGLFNIVAAWIHQYLGHMLTLVCLLGGLVITVISVLLLYT